MPKIENLNTPTHKVTTSQNSKTLPPRYKVPILTLNNLKGLGTVLPLNPMSITPSNKSTYQHLNR